MNLIYICVFYQESYINLLKILINSLDVKGKVNKETTHILIITSNDFLEKIQKTLSDFDLPLYYYLLELNTIFQASCCRLNIFNYSEINKYEKILYLDTDILINGDLNTLFNLKINEDKIYVLEEGTTTYEFWGSQFFDNIPNQKAFTAGILFFCNNDSIKSFFKIVLNHINEYIYINNNPIPVCLDQPFIVYNTFIQNNYDNQLMKSYIENNPSKINKEIIIYHFPGNFSSKYDKMFSFWNKIKGDHSFFYGIYENMIDVTETIIKDNISFIPSGDFKRAELFGDPVYGTSKSIFIKKDNCISKYSENIEIILEKDKIITNKVIKPVIVCIAKFENDYIDEWIQYHLSLGFDKIYLYDNEDNPTYNNLFYENVIVIHFPGKNYDVPVQYKVLSHFVCNYMYNFTHVTHIDIDEFITLKKHSSIKEFIREYIHGDCAGICMNWRHFGSNSIVVKNNQPVTQRFTRCEKNGDPHIKVLFDTSYFVCFRTVHNVDLINGYYIKTTKGIPIGNLPTNIHIDFSVIQLNHYKCKTLPEFQFIRSRGRADMLENPLEDIENDFKILDLNEIEDLTAKKFYSNNLINFKEYSITNYLNKLGFLFFEGHSQQVNEEVKDLKMLSKDCKNILEIGFNAGHSSEIFLNNTNANVVSFDLGEHDYVKHAKKFIDNFFPNRHTLILGDSRITIPQYDTNIKFDLIFIDGGHDYEIAKSDIENCKKFTHSDSIVIIDDISFKKENEESWTIGPTKAWLENIKNNNIKQVNFKEYSKGRGIAYGKYS